MINFKNKKGKEVHEYVDMQKFMTFFGAIKGASIGHSEDAPWPTEDNYRKYFEGRIEPCEIYKS